MRLQAALRRAEEDAEVRCVAADGGRASTSVRAVTSAIRRPGRGSVLGDDGQGGRHRGRLCTAAQKVDSRRHGISAGCSTRSRNPRSQSSTARPRAQGLAIALACDLRFCLDTAKLTTAFVKIGLSGDSGGAYFLPQLVGTAKAKELYFTGDVVTGREALGTGAGHEGGQRRDLRRKSHAGTPSISQAFPPWRSGS